MAKDNTIIWIVVIVGILFLISKGYIELPGFEFPDFSGGDTNVNVNIEGQDDTTNKDTEPTQQNLCDAYISNYPTYFTIKEIQCGAAGGDWICKQDKAGCFDITSWDHVTMCASSDVQLVKAFCASQGGNWECTATSVGCDR